MTTPDPETSPSTLPQRWYFPYPLLLTTALVVVSGFAIAHAWYIRRFIEVQRAANGGELPGHLDGLVTVMLVMVGVLILFVAAAVLARLRLRLTIEGDALIIHRLFAWKRPRAQRVPLTEIHELLVEQTPRRDWRLEIAHLRGRERLPLQHARPHVAGLRAPGPTRIRDAESARQHPLVNALAARLNDDSKLRVRAQR